MYIIIQQPQTYYNIDHNKYKIIRNTKKCNKKIKKKKKKECTHTARKEEKKNKKKNSAYTQWKTQWKKKKKKRKQDQKHFYFLPIYTNTKATSYTTLKKTTQQTRKKKDIFGQNKNKESPHILPIINKGWVRGSLSWFHVRDFRIFFLVK